jgi:hypothetical protein
MGLLLSILAGATCVFYLYVLIQFRRDELRPRSPEGSSAGPKGGEKRVVAIQDTKARKGATTTPRESRPQRLSYVETTLPIAAVVPRSAKTGGINYNGVSSRRIA